MLMCPESGSSKRTRQRASVDFPEPDSPTTPKVAPLGRIIDTPSRACVTRPLRCRTPRLRYVFDRLLTTSAASLLTCIDAGGSSRSEEHTSELPVTNAHLVCRLLLEQKKNYHSIQTYTIHSII